MRRTVLDLCIREHLRAVAFSGKPPQEPLVGTGRGRKHSVDAAVCQILCRGRHATARRIKGDGDDLRRRTDFTALPRARRQRSLPSRRRRRHDGLEESLARARVNHLTCLRRCSRAVADVGHGLKPRASQERIVPDVIHRRGDRHVGQSGAIRERAVKDSRQAVRERQARQAGALVESTRRNRRNGGRNHDPGHAGTFVESISADGRNVHAAERCRDRNQTGRRGFNGGRFRAFVDSRGASTFEDVIPRIAANLLGQELLFPLRKESDFRSHLEGRINLSSIARQSEPTDKVVIVP